MHGHGTHKVQHRRIITTTTTINIITTTKITYNFTLQWCTNHGVKFCPIIAHRHSFKQILAVLIFTMPRQKSLDITGNMFNTECQVVLRHSLHVVSWPNFVQRSVFFLRRVAIPIRVSYDVRTVEDQYWDKNRFAWQHLVQTTKNICLYNQLFALFRYVFNTLNFKNNHFFKTNFLKTPTFFGLSWPSSGRNIVHSF